jgi:hypothetical protein
MEKPIINNFQTLGTLLIQRYERYIPNAFDESMSLVQKVNKVIMYLDQIGQLTNDVIDQWNTVMTWLLEDGLNEIASEEVGKKIFEMIASGEFDDIINLTILGQKADKKDVEELAFNLGVLGAKDVLTDSTFDNKTIFEQAFALLPNGGTIILPKGKTFVTDSIEIPSNFTLDLNGSTLKLKSNVSEYHNLITVGSNAGVTTKNVIIKNGKLDGNRVNVPQNFFHYGVYLLNVDSVHLENLEIVSCDGEGIFVGYTGYLAKNVSMKDIRLSDNTRNDLAITNADKVFADNFVINSTAYDSASVDLELQDNTDTLKNIYLNNFTIESLTQPMKVLTMGYTGVTDNVNISNFKFTGDKGLSIDSFDHIKLTNIESSASVQIIGSKNISVRGFKGKGVNGTGLYLYKSPSNRRCEHITLDDVNVSESLGYGLILQDTINIQVNNLKSYNNVNAGLGIMYNNQNIQVSGAILTDTRATNKTQNYGIEFQGSNTEISFANVYTTGNLSGKYLNYPTAGIFQMTPNAISLVSPDGIYGATFELTNEAVLESQNYIKSRLIGLNDTFTPDVDWIPNGFIFEDATDGKLKYKNLAGVISILSN